MTKPLPLKHAAAEPWLSYLRDLKAHQSGMIRPAGLLKNAPEPRELTEAAIDIALARSQHAARYGQN